MKVETGINLEDVVYINHKQYKVTKISTYTKLDQYKIEQTSIEYGLEYIDDKRHMPNAFLITYSRTDFLTRKEYIELLTGIVNSLTEY
jgi:hypothetical protein